MRKERRTGDKVDKDIAVDVSGYQATAILSKQAN